MFSTYPIALPERFMKPTIAYLEQKFDVFNREMFGGNLPTPSIELSRAKTYLGICMYQKRRRLFRKTESLNFRLRFSTCFDLPEQEWEDTLIHEMIHYYIGVNQLKDTSSHGTLFKQMMDTINRNFGRHITISHKSTTEQREQSYDTRQRWHVVAVVKMQDGRTGVKVLPRIEQRIINYYNQVGSSKQVAGMSLYLCKDAYFNRFPCSSALNVVFADYLQVTEHLADATPVQCDGKHLIPVNHI